MKIYITRHGQTDMNKRHVMCGRTDIPLNETGRQQAEAARARIGNVHFDAVYASPLHRAITTAAIIGGVPETEIVTDPRIIEFKYGKYEGKRYECLGPAMTMFWLLPEVFRAPESVETISSAVARTSSFLSELEKNNPGENVLVVCHGGIIRALCGYLEDRPNGIKWRPHPHNCEVRVYESVDGKHRFLQSYV